MCRLSLLAAKSSKSAESSKSAMAAKDVTEHGENVFHIHALSIETGCAIQSFVSKLVIFGSLFLIVEHFIGFGRFFEFLFGFFIVWIAIGMILDR